MPGDFPLGRARSRPIICVYSTRDGRPRLIAFDDDAPPAPPLEFVAAFPRRSPPAAWELLEELGLPVRTPASLLGN